MSFNLWPRLEEAIDESDRLVAKSREKGLEMAVAEAHYYTVKGRRSFALKRQGHPVSFISQVIKGDEEVNAAMLDYHTLQVEYENSREAIMVGKKRVDTLREQMQREWSQAGQR